jgi:hypothetical protein
MDEDEDGGLKRNSLIMGTLVFKEQASNSTVVKIGWTDTVMSEFGYPRSFRPISIDLAVI